VQRANAANTRQDQGHHQRTTGQTEFECGWKPWQKKRDRAQQHAQANANKHWQHVHLLQFVLRVAHHF
jgi:hypothetical protein